MEKITILVGVKDAEMATLFLESIETSLKNLNIDVVKVSKAWRMILETKYIRVAFIHDITMQPLNGVEADAIFGREPYRQRLAPYLKKHKVYNNDVGLLDYIRKEEINAKFREANEAFYKVIEDSIHTKIGKALHEAAAESIKEAHVKPLYHEATADAIKEVNPESLYPKQIYISTGRGGAKSELCRRYMEAFKEMDIPISHELAYYSKADCDITYDLWRKMNMNNNPAKKPLPAIKNVIFNNPATIVFWADGTKTVVQAIEGDIYDPEKGLAMAMCKKMLGNKHEYYNTFKHWLKKCKE